MGGNLLQRTRCPYFRADTVLPCNKRVAGSGCAAIGGDTEAAAIFGWTDQCVATHPSDLAVALAALDATVVVRGAAGKRGIPAAELPALPGADPSRHTELGYGELIIAIRLPAPAPPRTISRSGHGRPTSSRWCRPRLRYAYNTA